MPTSYLPDLSYHVHYVELRIVGRVVNQELSSSQASLAVGEAASITFLIVRRRSFFIRSYAPRSLPSLSNLFSAAEYLSVGWSPAGARRGAAASKPTPPLPTH